MEKHLEYLQKRIKEDTSLPDIVDVFEQMCQMPYEDTMLLFETGRFSYSGDYFYFSLTRQYPYDDEYIQLHINVMYEPNAENAVFSKAVWDIDLRGSLFDYIRNSPAYAWAKKQPICKIDIWMSET